eukprot:COSAG02_NODE_30467_length_550_cov_1.376940_1_plen_43_part_10
MGVFSAALVLAVVALLVIGALPSSEAKGGSRKVRRDPQCEVSV